jgi:transcriptional regulator with XRE-family HTH domain
MEQRNVYRDFTRGLGFKMRIIRDHLGLQLNEAGEKFDISNSLISLYESGKENPNLLYLKKLTEAAGLSVDDLLLDKSEFIKKLYFG